MSTPTGLTTVVLISLLRSRHGRYDSGKIKDSKMRLARFYTDLNVGMTHGPSTRSCDVRDALECRLHGRVGEKTPM